MNLTVLLVVKCSLGLIQGIITFMEKIDKQKYSNKYEKESKNWIISSYDTV